MLALLFSAGILTPAINAGGVMCKESGMSCDNVKMKSYGFKNMTDKLLELDLKLPQDGKAIVVLPIKDLQNPNFFSTVFKYTNMEDPTLIVKHCGKPVPFTVFKGNYSTATKNQVRSQCPAGHYKIISNPYKVGFHLLLLDESVNVEDIKDKLQ